MHGTCGQVKSLLPEVIGKTLPTRFFGKTKTERSGILTETQDLSTWSFVWKKRLNGLNGCQKLHTKSPPHCIGSNLYPLPCGGGVYTNPLYIGVWYIPLYPVT